MVHERIRGGKCHAIRRYAKENDKSMNGYNKDKESSCLIYWDANNLYGWAMSQKFLVDNFEWEEKVSSFDEKNHDENRDKGCIFEVHVEYPKNLHNLHTDLPFLPERMKAKKFNKLVRNLYHKEKYVVHIKTLKLNNKTNKIQSKSMAETMYLYKY